MPLQPWEQPAFGHGEHLAGITGWKSGGSWKSAGLDEPLALTSKEQLPVLPVPLHSPVLCGLGHVRVAGLWAASLS